MTGTVVSVAVLRAACLTLLTHLEEMEGSEVRLDRDHFWSIVPTQLYDVMHEPNEFTIGQLTECLDHVQNIVDDPSRSTSYALVWLADLLRAIGQVVVQ